MADKINLLVKADMLDTARREVFGFASVAVNHDGQQFVDLQGDMIEPEALENAAYEHVLKYRAAGEQHDRGDVKGKQGDLIESCVLTPAKIDKLFAGIVPPEILAGFKKAIGVRWLVGYRFEPGTFAKVVSGELPMFSIQGHGEREEVVT